MNVLRACGACGGHWIGYRTRERTFPALNQDPFFCPKHRAQRDARITAWIPAIGHRCHVATNEYGPFSDLIVISIDGDYITTQILGQPGQRTVYHRNNLIPGKFGVI